jgi:hypothetical protein
VCQIGSPLELPDVRLREALRRDLAEAWRRRAVARSRVRARIRSGGSLAALTR